MKLFMAVLSQGRVETCSNSAEIGRSLNDAYIFNTRPEEEAGFHSAISRVRRSSNEWQCWHGSASSGFDHLCNAVSEHRHGLIHVGLSGVTILQVA